MPETPDFDKLAGRLVSLSEVDLRRELRILWNERGAVDIAAVDTTLSIMMGGSMSGPYLKTLERELKQLDR